MHEQRENAAWPGYENEKILWYVPDYSAMDALHVACAIEARAEYFLTTDKALLRKMAKCDDIKVVDPVDFIRALKDGNDEN